MMHLSHAQHLHSPHHTRTHTHSPTPILTLSHTLTSGADGVEVRIMADALCNYFKHLLRKNLTEIIAKTHAIALKGNMGSSQIQVRKGLTFGCSCTLMF